MTGATVSAHQVLQITDVHLRAEAEARLLGVDTYASAAAVLEQALAEGTPDALLVTGDLTHDPEAAAYRRFVALIRSYFSGPTLVLPGNHDVLAAMTVLAEAGLTEPQLRLGPWQILALDSHVDDAPEAEVDAEEVERLRRQLVDSEAEHVLIATHHPPIPIGCPWLDKDRIQNGSELLESFSEHGTVRAMVFGHAHQEISSTHRDIALLGTPSTCFQFEPGSERFAIDERQGERQPGYRWLSLGADGSLHTEVKRVHDFPLTIDRSQFRPKE
ncbi:MAG: metallophosphoesterase [Pseudomonadota bacterium]